MLISVYKIYIQGLCQSRLNTADFSLFIVAWATTVQSLERSYAWLPPSLSPLYFLCRASPCPILRTFSLSWFCITSACCLYTFVIRIIVYVRNFDLPCLLYPIGTDHSGKHSLGADLHETPACITSIFLWRHRTCVNCVRSIATVRARITENTAPVLLAA
jgi:hypothetical protein